MLPCERNPENSGRSDRSRAQSETLGFVLLFSLVLVGAGTVLAFGAVAVSDSQQSLSADRAEKVMTQMDSEISMVALGRTDSQRMRFERAGNEKFSIEPDSGTINITTVDENGKTVDVIMPDTNLGAVVYENDDTVIAYQGGGVWRTDGREGSGMVSPPEFNYREQTLTLPLVTVTGDDTLSREAVVRKNGPSTRFFPDETGTLTNPLEDNLVRVTIETEYHDGWRSYFESRTEGAVTHDPANQTVTVELTAPEIENFDNGIAVTGSQSDIETKGNAGAGYENTASGIDATSANGTIEQKISECSPSSCKDLTNSETGSSSTITAGTYYSSSNVSFDSETTFDLSDGTIEIIVDSDVEFKGGNDKPDHKIINADSANDYKVKLYVREDFKVSGNAGVNTDGDASHLVTMVHEDGDVSINGNAQYTGVIYAPYSDFTINGGGACGAGEDCNNVVGGVVAESATAKGNGYVEHQRTDTALELDGGSNPLTFLHISTNPVVINDS